MAYVNQNTYSSQDGFPITPNDSTVFPQSTRAIWVGGTGAVAVTMVNGTVLTFTGVPSGTLLPLQVQKVMATNTTATALVGLV